MSEKNALITKDKDELSALGHEIKTLLPGGNKLSGNEAVSLGKYATLSRANPFRGEVYGYKDRRGNLQLVDGYKLLVRWAKRICEYNEKYELLPPGVEGLKDGDIGYRCVILRDDKKSDLKLFVDVGASFQEAYELASSSAIGVVNKKDMFGQKGAIDPPKGWTWDQVARKRALKNTLNMAYAMPSVDELMSDSWIVDGVTIQDDDWAPPEIYKTEAEAEQHAKLAANERVRQEKKAAMTEDERAESEEKLAEANAVMRDNGLDDDPLGESKPLSRGMDASTKFWKYVNSNGISREEAGEFIRDANGDFDSALEAIGDAY